MATLYEYENRTALDPYTREGEPNAVGYVFDKSDITFQNPLTVTMVSSGLQAQELVTDQYCQLPSFRVEDRVQVVFKSGDFTKLLNTTTPLVGPAGPAVSEAVDNGNGTVTFKLPDGSEAATVALPQATHLEVGTVETVAGSPLDAAVVADQIGTPGTLAHTALSATIATGVEDAAGTLVAGPKAQMRGNRAIYLGDSIGVAGEGSGVAGGVAHNFRGESPLVFASVLTGNRLQYVRNASIGGDTSSEALARWDTDVAPYDFSLLIVCLGTNDSFEEAPLSLYSDNIKEMHRRCRERGAELVLCTILPNKNTSGVPALRKTHIAKYNAWLRRYAADNGLTLVDYHDALIDPATGDIKAAWDGDGTHPNLHGYYEMGKRLAADLGPHLPLIPADLPLSNVAPLNKVSQGLFLGTIDQYGTPQGWSVVGTQHKAGITASLVTNDTAIKGNWYKHVISGLAATDTTFQIINGITGGNKYRFTGRIDAAGLVNVTLITRLLFNSSTATGYEFRALNSHTHDLPKGVFSMDVTAPADATNVQVNMQIIGTAGSAGTVSYGQIGFYDLTAAGIP